ncbi:MAG: insulinase family protein [Candidatus Marinimicrobia bacterium]|nr:insulinase family protein [Candidatus Neomarinimicrobiota bacterium]MCF7902018.1 insulinase family protein [Candidatus Neomarinimicrobiota bacterium]
MKIKALLLTFILAPPGLMAGIETQEYTLSNGMQVLVVERHEAPVVSTRIWFDVGSVDEPRGSTGMAHLLEHMLFKGTQTLGVTDYEKEKVYLAREDSLWALIDEANLRLEGGDESAGAEVDALREAYEQVLADHKELIIKNELWDTYLNNGATGLNASTSTDWTQYQVQLPANRLELWASIESDRMARPVFREYYSERDVVKEERRRSYETRPFGLMYLKLYETAYTIFPYKILTIGLMEDLFKMKLSTLDAFFRRYYAPNRATAVVVGDVYPDELIPLMEKYFGQIPSQPDPPLVTVVEPTQTKLRKATVEFDSNPALMMAWHMGDIQHPDNAALNVLADVLTDGRTSRIYKTIVEEKQLASNVWCSPDPGKYPGLFVMSGTTQGEHTNTELETALLEIIRDIQENGITEKELARVKKQSRMSYLKGLRTNAGLSFQLGYYATVGGDWRLVEKFPEEIKAVTAEDVQRVANTYLKDTNRTVVYLVPPTEQANAGEVK